MKKRSQSTENAPVVLFTYNRVNVLKKLLKRYPEIWKLKKQNYLFFQMDQKTIQKTF